MSGTESRNIHRRRYLLEEEGHADFEVRDAVCNAGFEELADVLDPNWHVSRQALLSRAMNSRARPPKTKRTHSRHLKRHPELLPDLSDRRVSIPRIENAVVRTYLVSGIICAIRLSRADCHGCTRPAVEPFRSPECGVERLARPRERYPYTQLVVLARNACPRGPFVGREPAELRDRVGERLGGEAHVRAYVHCGMLERDLEQDGRCDARVGM